MVADKNGSQEQLAKKVDVSRQTISAIEKGNYNPSVNLCIKICQALDKTLDDLFWPEREIELIIKEV
ncbi:helix-turn-helix transcriptional regulator [Lactobacillus gallinarum]|uniref:helix-turn-helix transcriptional regulator n=1 Tax=Lactobacillus gallinarum TaxID=52242 RepID=UPI0024BAD54F|nr:helix-turn-helix transcriptional regulator [Lactobacillus gallinarum]